MILLDEKRHILLSAKEPFYNELAENAAKRAHRSYNLRRNCIKYYSNLQSFYLGKYLLFRFLFFQLRLHNLDNGPEIK